MNGNKIETTVLFLFVICGYEMERKEKLYNRQTATELKKTLELENISRTTISFYQYFHIENPQKLRDEMYKEFYQLKVFGRTYIANEGINSQLSIPTENLPLLKQYLEQIPQLRGIRLNIAVDDNGKSFWVLKIKVRKNIVADGIADPTFSMQNKGKYINAEEFNQLTENPDVIVIDMRNHYEYEIGHFKNALEVPSDTFREQLPKVIEMMEEQKNKQIIMYCTGGIRCEKASAWMLHNGFKNVYHLEGGIINYANIVKQKNLPNKFIGKNFVFDNRLSEKIGSEIISMCHQCGSPSYKHTNCANDGCHLLFIQCDSCKNLFNNCCSNDCQSISSLPIDEQKKLRKGAIKNANIFNKSKNQKLFIKY